GDSGRLAAIAVYFHHRRVKGVQHRKRPAAADLDVGGATKFFAVKGGLDWHLVVAFGFVDADDDLSVNIRTDRDRWPEHPAIQRAAGCENGITNDFSIEPLNRF